MSNDAGDTMTSETSAIWKNHITVPTPLQVLQCVRLILYQEGSNMGSEPLLILPHQNAHSS